MALLVTIIVPIYGTEKYIRQCAESIFKQTYQNIEFIFVNDCTKDRSLEILKEVIEEFPLLKKRIKVINNSQNSGLAFSRKAGLNVATGDYIIHFDSDDFVEPTIIEELVNCATNESADIVICDYDLVTDKAPININVNPPLNKDELISRLFIGDIHSSLCNKLIKKDIYTINNITPIEGLNMHEDLLMTYKLVYYSQKIAYIPSTLYHYRLFVQGSYTSVKMSDKLQTNKIQLLEDVNTFITQKAKLSDVPKLRNSFKYLITRIKSEILFYGNLDNMTVFKQKDFRVTFHDIIRHPCLNIVFKLICLCDKFYLKPLIRLARFFYKIYKR